MSIPHGAQAPTLYTISTNTDVFVDALLTDDGNGLLFLSLWGRDTALQEFVARLSLPSDQDGIDTFRVYADKEWYARIPNIDRLTKQTTRIRSGVFGDISNLWIYDKCLVKPDYANRRAVVIESSTTASVDIWPLIKSVCHLPLLDAWQQPFLDVSLSREWRKPLWGLHVSGWALSLPCDEVEEVIKHMISTGAVVTNTDVLAA